MTTGKKIVYTFLAAMVPTLLLAFSGGPDPRYTAAPGDSPLACATAGCHTGSPTGGPINAAGGAVTATFSTGSSYTPGQPVTITVNVTDPVNSLHGFQMTARLENNLSTAQAGRFSFASNAGVFVLCDNNVPRTPSGNCPANFPVEFIEHSSPRTGTWTFTWTPPATDQGPIHFYVAGNAVNGDATNGPQDHVYTASFVLQPPASCAQSIPVITEVRRIEGWGDPTTFSAGSWLEIKGSNLAQNTRLWLDSDFNGNNAPTSLDGTSALVNGKAGFIEYISSTQINLEAPADSATGPVPVTVTNCAGTSNAATGPTLQKAAPGILAPPPEISPLFTAGGKQYGEATFGFQFLFVGNNNPDFPGLFVPAKPNDSILLYAIGLGDTTPAMVPGVKASGQEVLNAQVAVKFGTTPATVNRVSLYPTFAGLYYIIVTVPNVADGDYQINITVDGQPLKQDPFFLTVHK